MILQDVILFLLGPNMGLSTVRDARLTDIGDSGFAVEAVHNAFLVPQPGERKFTFHWRRRRHSKS
jgi:hypothetical protein